MELITKDQWKLHIDLLVSLIGLGLLARGLWMIDPAYSFIGTGSVLLGVTLYVRIRRMRSR